MTSEASINLLDFPDEILLHIFSFLEIPDLLHTSRTTHHFRSLALDPQLHHLRLKAASSRLSTSLPHRPLLSSLRPPNRIIYLSRTHVAARKISRSLICIRLTRCLARRPSAESLVSWNILPAECVDGKVAPGLVERRRKVQKERLKDGLRVWVERRAEVVEMQEREAIGKDKVSVRSLVQRLSRRAGVAATGGGGASKEKAIPQHTKAQARWGKGAKERCSAPTRAHVLGLRRFWEGVIKGSA